MIRYILQRDEYSCSVVALANALKWSGKEFSYRKTRKNLCKECKTTVEIGTIRGNLMDSLSKLGKSRFAIVNRYWFSLREITKHLQNPMGAIIICFREKDKTGHSALLTHATSGGGYFDIINLWDTGPAKQRISRNTLKKLLKDRDYASCLFLTKEKSNVAIAV